MVSGVESLAGLSTSCRPSGRSGHAPDRAGDGPRPTHRADARLCAGVHRHGAVHRGRRHPGVRAAPHRGGVPRRDHGGQQRQAGMRDDLSLPARRPGGTSRSVWATAVGSVLGPNLSGPGKVVAAAVGLPPLTGPTCSRSRHARRVAVMFFRLRPDPLMCWPGPNTSRNSLPGRRQPGPPDVSAGEPTAASRGDQHEPEPRGHRLGHGDDSDPHGSRPRLVGDHRPGHQHPHPRDVRLLARPDRHGR